MAAGTAYLYYAAKTAALFVSEGWAYVIVPTLAAPVYSSAYFAHGDSAEELCLPLLMVGFYRLMRFFKEPDSLTPRVVAVCGVLAGCVLWIKYTMLGFWLAFMLAVFVALLLKKQLKRALMLCTWFLSGMLATTLPWFIYFAADGALGDWFHTYFTLNITAYAKAASAAEVFRNAWENFYANVSTDKVLTISVLLGLVGFVGTRRLISGVWAKIAFVLLPVLLVLGVYGGGRSYPYYFLIVAGMLMLPGMIALAWLISGIGGMATRSRVGAKPTSPLPRWIAISGCIVLLVASVLYAYSHYQYKYFMTAEKDMLAQTQFAKIMNREENPTLLNYGFLDGGFYTAADILPTEKYFCLLNVPLREMTQAQDAAVRNKAIQFVVMRSGSKWQSNGSALLEQNYELVAQIQQVFEHRPFTYSLYRLRDSRGE